jgi:LPXTG-motif cell wall-anchored protein
MTPRALASGTVALAALALPGAAHADGPPTGYIVDGGITAGSIRYAALPAGHGTLIEKLALNGGRPLRFHYVGAPAGVPMVAMDGTAGGLSHDASTLVLGRPRDAYPERHSTLYVLNARRLNVRRRISLGGDFSFDAISPDGRTIYLTQLSRRSFTQYSIRAFDTKTWRLLPKPVVDREEPDEAMAGLPFTRVTSPDGRFDYTLYVGGDKPFVHALDTVGRSAKCIDLPPIPDGATTKLHLSGRRLTVFADGAPVAVVDTATPKVSKPAPARPVPLREQAGNNGDGSNTGTWLAIAGAAAALAATAALGARRRRTRRTA